MTPSEKLDLIRAIYAQLLSTGSPQMLLDNLTDDARCKVSIGPDTPLSGEFVGKEAVIGYLRTLDTVAEILGINVYDYLANDTRVVVFGDESIRLLASDVSFSTEWASVFTFRGDKIAYLLIIENLGAISQAYGAPPAPPIPRAS